MPGPFPPRSQRDRVHRLATRMGGSGGVGGSTSGVGPVLRPIRPLGLPVPVAVGSSGGVAVYSFTMSPAATTSGSSDSAGTAYSLLDYSAAWAAPPVESGPAGTVTRS